MKSEAAVQAEVMMRLSEMGHRIFRNNNGAAVDQTGRHVRYGLGNVSQQVNARMKSSDLIGIEKGTGRMISIECKREGWKYKGTDREQAQLNWINLIKGMGGIGGFVSDVGQLEDLLTTD